MLSKFKKQHWALVLVLIIITLGIYLPFWYKKTKKVTDTLSLQKPVNNFSIGLINALIYVSILRIIFNFSYQSNVNGIIRNVSTNIYGIGWLLSLIYCVLAVILGFALRDILKSYFNKEINPILTLFLGPIYLEYVINKFDQETPAAPVNTINPPNPV